MDTAYLVILIITILSGFLVIYHHVLFPVLMKRMVSNLPDPAPISPDRQYRTDVTDDDLPDISIIIPCYNETEVIAEKIRNLAAIDYPEDKLSVFVACDGCTDDTAEIARNTGAEPEVQHLHVTVLDFPENRGKVAVLNATIPEATGSIVALTDASALVSVDSLLVSARHFSDPDVGVVAGTYRILQHGSDGEEAYWKYQLAVKRGESAMGAPLGVHGAFYLFRRALFRPLPADTINDDFVLPMDIVAQNYRALYEPEIMALELECANDDMDQRRRRRIAAGNMQQAIRMRHLLNPKHGGIAFAFASGKALRAIMPFLLICTYVGSIILGTSSILFAALAVLQTIVYGLALWRQAVLPKPVPKIIGTIHYIVAGHFAGMIGALRYLLGFERGAWKRVTDSNPD